MTIVMESEIELNRRWILDDDGETVGETNFVVPMDWFIKNWNSAPNPQCCEDIIEFEDIYEPEIDGEWLYQKAIKDGVIKEDMGVVVYK